MNALAPITAAVVDEALEAMVLNGQQERAIYDPSPEIDSLVERLVLIARATTGPAHAAAIAALGDAKRLQDGNRAERRCEEAIPPLVEHRGRGIRAAQRALRDPLADLLNPMIAGEDRDRAMTQVRWVLKHFPESVLRDETLRRDFGSDRKFELLQRLLDEAKAARP